MTIGIFLDLTKAFDLVKHDILVTKLEKYSVRGPAIELIKSVQIKGEKSESITVKMSVPQGSV